MDNLTMNAIQCKVAGVSYGQWKAMHPVTRVIETDEGMLEKSCPHCGKRFKTKNKRKVFCNDDCCNSAQVARRSVKKRGVEHEEEKRSTGLS